MNNYIEEIKNAKEMKDMEDIGEILAQILEIQKQLYEPTRDGMIAALSNAKRKAPKEISDIELSQGGIYSVPFNCVKDDGLYSKLYQYQQGLINAGITKVGNKAFEKLLEQVMKS